MQCIGAALVGSATVSVATAAHVSARRRVSGWRPDPVAPGTTIGEGLRGHDNALGLVRLLLASAVVVSHAFPLGGLREDPFQRWSLNQQNLGGVAVLGFFAISGYLITKSGMANDIARYLWARVLRIFPAFWTVLLLSVFVVGPLVWHHEGRPLADYFTTDAGGSLHYLDNWRLTVRQWGIGDLFVNTPYGDQVHISVLNGSLWTLIREFRCYLLIGVLVLFASRAGFRVGVPLFTALLFALQIVKLTGGNPAVVVPWLNDPQIVYLALTFMVGACIAVYSDKVPLDDRLGWLALAVAVATYFRGGFLTLGIPALAYAVLWLGARLPARLRVIGSQNDYSYGIYLYGFLVEQIVAWLGWWQWGYVPYVAISMALTWVAAFLSWHVVEKQALKLKDRGPGRGLAYWRGRLAGLTAPRRKAATQ